MSNIVALPNEYFPFFDKSGPIWNAKIYIGQPDTDPTIPANQLTVTARQESGDTVGIPQPVRTSSGGVPTYNGSPAQILVDGNYSIAVHDKNDKQIYYYSNFFKGQPVTSDSLGDLTNYQAASVADMVQGKINGYINVSPKLNQIWATKGFSQNNVGAASYDVVLTSTVTPDGKRVIQSTLDPDYSFVLRFNKTTWLEQWGLVEGGDFYEFHNAATTYIRSISDSNKSNRVVIRCMSGSFAASDTVDFYPFQAPFTSEKEVVITPTHSNTYVTRVAPSAYNGASGSVPIFDRQPQAFIDNLTIITKENQRSIVFDSDLFNPSGSKTYLSYLGLKLSNVQLAAETQFTTNTRGYEFGQNAYEVVFEHCISWYLTEHVLGKDVASSPIPPNTGVGLNFNKCYFIYANESVTSQRGFTLISNQYKATLDHCSILHLHEPFFLQNGASVQLTGTRVEGARMPEGANAGQNPPSVDGWIKIVSGGQFTMTGGDMINYLPNDKKQFQAPFYVQNGTEEQQVQINMTNVDFYGCRGLAYEDLGGVLVAFSSVGDTADINFTDCYRRHKVSPNGGPTGGPSGSDPIDDDPLHLAINNRNVENGSFTNPFLVAARNATDGDGTGFITEITNPSLGLPSNFQAIRLQRDGTNNTVLSLPFGFDDTSKQVTFSFYAQASEPIPYKVRCMNIVRDYSSFRQFQRFGVFDAEPSGSISDVTWTAKNLTTTLPVGGYDYAVLEFDFSSTASGAYIDIYGLIVDNFR